MKFVIIAEHAHDIYTGGAKREEKRGDKQKTNASLLQKAQAVD